MQLWEGMWLLKFTRGWHTNISCTPIFVLGQSGQTRKISLDSWLSLKIALDFWPYSSTFFVISRSHWSIDRGTWYIYRTAFVLWPAANFQLDFWLSLWPRSKIRVQDILKCHPLNLVYQSVPYLLYFLISL